MPTAPAPVGFIPSIPRPFVPILPFLEQDDSFGQPTVPLVNYTEFYCTSGGSNLNAGSTTDNVAIYTSTNGNWSTVTNIFTPTDGSNPSAAGVKKGQFVSIYIDGATTAVYIALITLVAEGANGAITMDITAVYGTAPVTSATTRSIKVGGAWLGPSGASNFPFALSGTLDVLLNPNSYHVRVNAKNDQTYTLTAQLVFDTLNNAVLQGYTTTAGDGGKTTFTSNLAGVAFSVATNLNQTFIDLIFVSTSASTTSACFSSNNFSLFLRCVFHGARGSGLTSAGSGKVVSAIECEAYDCNKSNTVSLGGFGTNSGVLFCYNCYSHDHTSGSNANGYATGSATQEMVLINSIASGVTGNGAVFTSLVGSLVSINCDYYNIAGDAIKFANAGPASFSVIMNNNFVNVVGRGINSPLATQAGIIYNNGRGNIGLADQGNLVDTHTDIFYPLGVTPWNAPATGDFSKILAAAISSGRGTFTETDGTHTGTVSYPDIGAAQAQTATQAFNVPNVTQILSDGFLGHTYNWKYILNQPATFTLQSGTLPTGLALIQVDPASVQITGTPTVANQFTFTIRATVGASHGDSTYQLTVNADPDEGIGGLLGGLRPTC